MSVKISSLVWEACLKPEVKYILLALADQANDDGYCVYRKSQEMTISAIAMKTGLSERTVQRHISALLNPDSGFLEIVKEASHHNPPEYRIRGDKLSSLNTIVRGDRMSPLRDGQGCQIVTPQVQSGVTLTTVRGDIDDIRGDTGVTPHIRCLDVDSRNITLSTAERDFCVKEIKRLFPGVLSIPKEIPIERVYLFLHKVRLGEIRKEQIYSPIAYMSKMLDEDISGPLGKEREKRAARRV